MSSSHHHHWSWRGCFAAVKHNRKDKKHHKKGSDLQKLTSNGNANGKRMGIKDEHSRSLHNVDSSSSQVNDNEIADGSLLSSTILDEHPHHHYQKHKTLSNPCIIVIEPPSNENDDNDLIEEDTIEQVNIDVDSSSANLISTTKPTQLDSIVEDSSEEIPTDEIEETIEPIRLYCDREIVDDCRDFHSRLADLSTMNHVVTQFRENGDFLGDFTRQIDKLKIKTDDVIRASTDMPRDAELLEARYSSLLATIESLSLLLKIAQIPASRSLINRLGVSIEQRMNQLNKLVHLPSSSVNSRRQDSFNDDFLSFRSALSSYEQLFTTST